MKTRQKNKNKKIEEENILFIHIIWPKVKNINGLRVYAGGSQNIIIIVILFKIEMRCINIIRLLPFSQLFRLYLSVSSLIIF